VLIKYYDQIKEDDMGCVEHVAQLEEKRNAYENLVKKADAKTPLGRPRHIWEAIIK
jgi:hypothetical protein